MGIYSSEYSSYGIILNQQPLDGLVMVAGLVMGLGAAIVMIALTSLGLNRKAVSITLFTIGAVMLLGGTFGILKLQDLKSPEKLADDISSYYGIPVTTLDVQNADIISKSGSNKIEIIPIESYQQSTVKRDPSTGNYTTSDEEYSFLIDGRVLEIVKIEGSDFVPLKPQVETKEKD